MPWRLIRFGLLRTDTKRRQNHYFDNNLAQRFQSDFL